jgi:hypothetical protein
MGNYQLIKTTPDHIDNLDISDIHEGEYSKDGLKLGVAANNVAAFTLIHKDKPVAVIGMTMASPGRGIGFGIMSKSIKEHHFAIPRATRFLSYYMAETYGVHRIEMTIRADKPHLRKWAKFLGFKEEGLMKKYGPTGLDYYLCARVF